MTNGIATTAPKMRIIAMTIEQLRQPSRPYPSSSEMVVQDRIDTGRALICVLTVQDLSPNRGVSVLASSILTAQKRMSRLLGEQDSIWQQAKASI